MKAVVVVKCSLGAVIMGLALLTGGCGQTQAPESELRHDAGAPLRNSALANWTAVSRSEYSDIMAPLLGLEGNFLEEKHEITKRAQFWIDIFDTNLRKRYANELKNVPKPAAMVIVNPDVNAFVAPMPVCLKAKVNFGTGGSVIDRAYFDYETSSLDNFDDGDNAQFPCRDDSASADALQVIKAMTSTFNQATPSQCRLNVTEVGGEAVITPTAACQRSDALKGVASAKQIMFLRTAAFVNVYTGLIPVMGTEDSFAGVIAHELGHYYRSHMTVEADFFGYFYRFGAANDSHRPAHGNAQVQTLGKNASAASSLMQAPYQPSTDLKVNSRAYLGMGTTILNVCKTDASCSADCKVAKKLITSSAYLENVQAWPFRELSAAGKTSVKDFETKAEACLKNISSGSRPWKDFVSDIGTPTYVRYIFQNANTLSSVVGWQKAIAKMLPPTAPSDTANAWKAYVAISANLVDIEAKMIADLKKAFDEHIGAYTFEQEADDESAEWMAQVALNPAASGDTQMNLGKWLADQNADQSLPLDLSYEECKKVRHAGWKSEDGAYKYIALGDYSEPHHGFCYRAFNIDREVQAHRFRAAGQAPVVPGPSWAAIQKAAADETGSGIPPIDESAPSLAFARTPAMKNIGARSCAAYGAGMRKTSY